MHPDDYLPGWRLDLSERFWEVRNRHLKGDVKSEDVAWLLENLEAAVRRTATLTDDLWRLESHDPPYR